MKSTQLIHTTQATEKKQLPGINSSGVVDLYLMAE